MSKKKIYRIKADAPSTKAAISEIQQQLRQDLKKEFLAGINEDGSVPRGLMASLAKKYGYSQAWVTKVLRVQGITLEHKVTQLNTQENADTL